MLENFNDYISFLILILIVVFFIFFIINQLFRSIERARIKREMEKRHKDLKGND